MPKKTSDDGLSRRQFIPRAAALAAAGAAGLAGYEIARHERSPSEIKQSGAGHATVPEAPGAVSDEIRTFATWPDLRVPAVRVTTVGDEAKDGPAYIFTAPQSY